MSNNDVTIHGYPPVPSCPRCGSDDPAVKLPIVANFGWYGKGRGPCNNDVFHTPSPNPRSAEA